MQQAPPPQRVVFQHGANPTQKNVYDRLLDQNYWTGSYKQRFNDYSQGRPNTAEYKPYEVGGAENFWEMRRKRKGQQAVDAGTGDRFASNLRTANLYDPRNRMCVDDESLETSHRGAGRRHADRRRTYRENTHSQQHARLLPAC